MRFLIILSSFIFVLCLNSYSQKKLALYKNFGGVVYEMDTLTLSTRQVNMVLKQNPEAFAEFRVARTKATIGSVLGFTSGLLVAIPLVTAVAGGQPEWIYAGGGAVLFLASIPFNASFRGHALNAIEIYNSKQASTRIKINSTIHYYGTGASIVIRF